MREPLNRKYIIIALNEGAAWVDRHCPHLHLLHVLFISFLIKGILESPFPAIMN
jgi:hypothetical protein